MCVCVELYIIRFCQVDVFTNCRCLGKRNSLHDSLWTRQCTKEIKREPVGVVQDFWQNEGAWYNI